MKPLALIIMLTISAVAFAQDNIVFTDGSEVKALVQEIGTEEVAYKKADNPDGPVYKVYKNTVFLIQFANGTSEVVTPFNLSQPVPETAGGAVRGKAFGGTYKSPGMAFLFSFLLPGGGQYYNKQYGKGGAMTALWLGGIVTAATAPYTYNDCYYAEPAYYEDLNGDYPVDDPGYYYDPYYYDYGYNCGVVRSPQRIVGNVVWAGTWLWSMIDAP